MQNLVCINVNPNIIFATKNLYLLSVLSRCTSKSFLCEKNLAAFPDHLCQQHYLEVFHFKIRSSEMNNNRILFGFYRSSQIRQTNALIGRCCASSFFCGILGLQPGRSFNIVPQRGALIRAGRLLGNIQEGRQPSNSGEGLR